MILDYNGSPVYLQKKVFDKTKTFLMGFKTNHVNCSSDFNQGYEYIYPTYKKKFLYNNNFFYNFEVVLFLFENLYINEIFLF